MSRILHDVKICIREQNGFCKSLYQTRIVGGVDIVEILVKYERSRFKDCQASVLPSYKFS